MNMTRKGIILAGGRGTRLYPVTLGVTKCLLPIYDKPLIYYSISTLMLSDIRDVLIITTPEDSKIYARLLGDGSEWGINISYDVQPKPEGIAQALIIGEKFLCNRSCALILADNIFHGNGLSEKLSKISKNNKNTVFTYTVDDPSRFGVCEVDENNMVISLEEKPIDPISNQAVTGLYFYDNEVSEIAKTIVPSLRGELEITDVNIEYMKAKKLYSEPLKNEYKWIDAGTVDSLMDACSYVRNIEKNEGIKISCPEEISYRKGWISSEMLQKLADNYDNDYGKYIKKLIS
jgi:glucose-1-phosphate thymidylyltransferase